MKMRQRTYRSSCEAAVLTPASLCHFKSWLNKHNNEYLKVTLEANLKLDNKWYKLGLDLLRTETQSQGIYKTLIPNLTNKDITITKHQH